MMTSKRSRAKQRRKQESSSSTTVHVAAEPRSQKGRWAWIGGILVATVTVLASSAPALRAVKSFNDWMRGDALIAGTWASVPVEGIVDSGDYPPPASSSEIIWLSIEVERGKISGMIYSPVLCRSLPWNYVQFSGTNNWFRATGVVFDEILGKKTGFAKYHLSRQGEALTLRNFGPDRLGLPQQVTLFRMPKSELFNDVPPVCRDFYKRMSSFPHG